MKAEIIQNLSTRIDRSVVVALVENYQAIIAEYRKGRSEECLNHSGKFVEHTLRALEGIRTGSYPKEIKSVTATIKALEGDTSLPESLRILVPRIASAMIFDVRSKRGAAHVKEISPSFIDAALVVQACSWIIAELVRLFHSSNDEVVAKGMRALMGREIPFVEVFADEVVVTKDVKCDVEILLQLTKSGSLGLSRRVIGERIKQSPSTVSMALTALQKKRYIHKTKEGNFHLTGPGENHLASELAETALHLPQ